VCSSDLNAWGLSAEQLQHVQGSETLIWTEMVDDHNLSQKLWPRSAALAEALWSGNNVPASANRAAKPTNNDGKGDKNHPTSKSVQSTSEDDDKRWYDAAGRMLQWRELLVARGVAAEALMPRWCSQRDAYACYLDTGVPQ
jgi:hexosaminidase